MPMAKLDFAKARVLCTAAELSLLKASAQGAIGKLSAAQLKTKIARARKLRDKWRGQSASQRRTVQAKQRGRGTGKAARSGEKAELFEAAISRFEQQLAKVTGEQPTAAGGSRPASTRTQRTRAQKQKRAQSRAELRGAKAQTNARPAAGKKRKKTAAKASGSTAAKAKKSKSRSATSKADSSAATSRTKKKASRKKQPAALASRAAAVAVASSSTTRPDKTRQRKAKSAAKRRIINKTGLTSRTRGHVSARGRRSQARRDARR